MRITTERLKQILAQTGNEELAGAIDEFVRPGIRLTPHAADGAELPLGVSRIGGHPDLPGQTPWPMNGDTPLGFLAQINLAEASRVSDELPRAGLLTFFYDFEAGPWGFDPADRPAFCVMFTPASAKLALREAPEELTELVMPARRLSFESIPTIPQFEAFNSDDGSSLSESLLERAEEIWGRQGEFPPLHQMLGHAFTVQSPGIRAEAAAVTRGIYLGEPPDMAVHGNALAAAEADAENWLLLLQLDTDDSAWMWGDMGLLYFMIHRDALAKCDTSNAWCILQCG